MKKLFFFTSIAAILAACGGSNIPDESVFRVGDACFKDPGVLKSGQRYILEDCSSFPPTWSFRHYDSTGVLRYEVTGGQRPEFVIFDDNLTFQIVYCVGTECIIATRQPDGKLKTPTKLAP